MELQIDSSPNEANPIHIDAAYYPQGALPGDLIAIRTIKGKTRTLLFKVPAIHDTELLAKRHKAPVVVSAAAAALLGVKFGRIEVNLELIIAPPAAEFCASYVELLFSNTYLSRPDMFRLTLSLNHSSLYQSQRISFLQSTTKLNTGIIYNEFARSINSAFINKTKIVFRSESAKSFIFIEVSKEMWQFEEDGNMLIEKCEAFLMELFSKPANDGNRATKHLVTIVLYGRVIYDDNGEGEEERAPLSRDPDGMVYRDFYKVILDPTLSPSPSTARLVTLEIKNWQQHVLLRTRPSGELKRAGRLAFAHESNVLEAVNLGLNTFDSHFIDRDLQRTGLSLIVVTAGCSFYHVNKELLRLTTERMLSLGLAIDLIALSKTPLHSVPLFSFYSQENELSKESPLYYDDPSDTTTIRSLFYYEPLFVFCSFFGDQRDKPHRIDRFLPRARMDELASQGVGGEKLPISIELLQEREITQTELDQEGWSFLSEGEKRQRRRDEYDYLAIGAKNGKNSMHFRKSGATSGTSASLGASSPEVHQSRKKSIVGTHSRVPSQVEERGRERRASDAHRIPSSTRSRTPMGRTRAPSVTSITTISSKASKVKPNISATPSLISRLTATATATTILPAPVSSRPSWLGIFRGATPTISNPPPSVGISKVATLANKKSMDSMTLSRRDSVESPNSSRRSSTLTVSARAVPSLPISIGSKTVDMPVKELQGPNSVSLTEYGPVEETKIQKSSRPKRGQKFNPSKSGRKIGEEDKERERRWSSLFIRHRKDETSVNWTSICQPACLPLTSDYLPSLETIASLYNQSRYSISTEQAAGSALLRVDNIGRSVGMELVEELICQRLSHGFQICLDSNSEEEEVTISEILNLINLGENCEIHLSLANQIHSISYQRRTQNVNINIFIKKRNWLKSNSNYSSLIWTTAHQNFTQTDVAFSYPNLIGPSDWEHLDKLVAGIERLDLRSTLRYWKTRLVLLPQAIIPDRDYIVENTKSLSSTSTDDDIRKTGFNILIEAINSAKWIHPTGEKEITLVETTDLSPVDWARKVAAEATRLANQITPVIQRPSRWLRRPAIHTAKDDLTNILSVERERTLSPDRRRELSPRETFASPPTATIELLPPTIPTVEMSFSLILDLDPNKKSQRAERVLCHIDKSHNPLSAYHVELNWLGGSGKIIDTTIQGWMRLAHRYGLSLMEVSCRGVEERWNPFVGFGEMKFAVTPSKSRFINHLLTSRGFYLDLIAESELPEDVEMLYAYRKTPTLRSQFIHRSGTVLVSILEDGKGLITTINRIYISHSSNNLIELAERVTKELEDICGDAIALQAVWDSAKEQEIM